MHTHKHTHTHWLAPCRKCFWVMGGAVADGSPSAAVHAARHPYGPNVGGFVSVERICDCFVCTYWYW